jgi:pimeloyl-[acyl-carrier protein] methyl ester esterase
MSEFKFFDRGAASAILLIPGWATDYRIFGSLDIRANYLIPVKFSPFDFEKDLLEAMSKNKLKSISIIGWSLGGFTAFDFLSKNKDKVDSVTFVSVRGGYKKEEIEGTRNYLNKNKTAFLYKFYNDCFSGNERDRLSCFKKGLMKNYLNEMSLETLFEGLDYLSASRITPQALKPGKVRFVHGAEDRIAPVKEAIELKDDMPGVELIVMEKTGHMPFLSESFKNIFDHEYIR